MSACMHVCSHTHLATHAPTLGLTHNLVYGAGVVLYTKSISQGVWCEYMMMALFNLEVMLTYTSVSLLSYIIVARKPLYILQVMAYHEQLSRGLPAPPLIAIRSQCSAMRSSGPIDFHNSTSLTYWIQSYECLWSEIFAPNDMEQKANWLQEPNRVCVCVCVCVCHVYCVYCVCVCACVWTTDNGQRFLL